MTTQLEQAARDALEALNRSDYLGWQVNIPIIKALRAALEQPAQDAPVAWADMDVRGEDKGLSWTPGHFHKTPLYTLPQAREPLTDEELDEAQDAAEESFHAMNKGFKPRPLSERASYFDWHLARAIEAAHGIKGEA